MEFSYDFNIIGEILIPLEHTLTVSAKEDQFQDLKSIFNKNLFDFRSVVFQNEILRLFVFIKMETIQGGLDPSSPKMEELFKDIDFTLELCFHNDNFTPFESKEQIKFITETHNDSLPLIKRRLFLEDSSIAVIELTKKVIIPNQHLDNSLMLKLDLTQKIDENYLSRIPLSQVVSSQSSLSRSSGVIKTLFKEIKVVQPFSVVLTEQLYLTPDKSMLQIRIENTTSAINYIDHSLKRSKCINQSLLEERDSDSLSYCFPIEIAHIEVKAHETREKTATITANSLNCLVSTMVMKCLNSMPVVIMPGEISNLTIELTRNVYLHDQLSSNDSIKSIAHCSEVNSTGSFFSVFSLLKGTNANELTQQKANLNVKKHKSVQLMTPININLKCNEHLLKGMFISLLALWRYEYKDSMAIEFAFEEKLIVNQMINMKMTVKNLTKALMDLAIEMTTAFEDVILDKQMQVNDRVKLRLNSNFPAFIAENKLYSIGKIEANQHKEIAIRFLAVKVGIYSLQDFTIIDSASNKKYTVINSNSIFINYK